MHRQSRRGSAFVLLLICTLLLVGNKAQEVECIKAAPKTYDDNEMLEFIKECMQKSTKYKITYE